MTILSQGDPLYTHNMKAHDSYALPVTFLNNGTATWCRNLAVSNVNYVLAFRLPWRVWGPLSLPASLPTSASSWRYAWTKTQLRGRSLTWLCQFWKKCRTSEKPPLPSLYWTDKLLDIFPQISLWYGGVVLTSIALNYSLYCCIQRHCSFRFWEESSSSHFFLYCFCFLFPMWYHVFIHVLVFVTDLLLLSAQELNIDCSSSKLIIWTICYKRLNSQWRSAWQFAALLHMDLRPYSNLEGTALFISNAIHINPKLVLWGKSLYLLLATQTVCNRASMRDVWN